MNRTSITFLIYFLSFFLANQGFSQGVMDFDGINDNVTVPNATSFIANSQMSLAAWVYPTNSSPGWPDFDGIVGFRNDVDADFYLLHLNATSIEARYRNSSGTNYDIVYSGINLNTWNHFVFTYDNSTLTLYHDGISVMTMAASGSITNTTEALNIGFLPFQTTPFYFDGQLDDVTLWDTSLSSAQVTGLYSSCSIDTSASNLVLAYEFNEGTPGGNNTGTTNVIDSKNNADGIISGLALTGTTSNFVADTKPLSASFISITEFSCGPFTSPSGNHVWTTSGLYNDTIFSTAGCDSIYAIDLSISAPTSASITVNECDFYTSPSGNTWTATGLYNDTIPNAGGCDSIIAIDLNINYSSNIFLQQSACESYTSPSGDYTWTSSGVYEDTIQNAVGCDSVLIIDLTIGSPSAANVDATACNSYISPSGNYEWTTSGTYADTISNMAGCDSVLSINLTITTINTAVTQLSNTELIANLSGVSYQWIDCSSGQAISGENNQSFIASSSGSYAVIVSDGLCSDTSSCVDLVTTGIFDGENTLSFQLFPNPAKDLVILSFDEFIPSFELTIVNALGQKIETRSISNRESVELDVSNLEAGIYIIQISDGENVGSMKFLKI